MGKTIDMQMMRYINLFEKICHVSTTNCFIYNNSIIFAVPKGFVSKAVGKNGVNIKKISDIFGKRVKVIEMIEDLENLDKFIADIVDPIKFTKLDLINGEVTISAGRQSKASLIGRNRSRQIELEAVLKKFFDVQKLKIA